MGMPMMPGFTPMTTEQHIETLEARAESVHFFVSHLENLLQNFVPYQGALGSALFHLERVLNFDTNRSIKILTEQLKERPKQCIQQLAMLTAQRDLYEGQLKIFQDNMKTAGAEHQEVINALAPLLNLVGTVLGNSLQGVNQEIARLQAEIETRDGHQSEPGA